jgi:transcriptional regulator with XRE-family HTH domain
MDDNSISGFIENLRKLMKERGIDNKQLSNMTGIPLSSIDRILGEISSPNRAAMEKISEALDVPIDSLIGKESAHDRDNGTIKDFEISEIEKEILIEYRKLPDNHWLKQAIDENLFNKSDNT